jgi:hypothetical protein
MVHDTQLPLRHNAKGEKNIRYTRMASCLTHCKIRIRFIYNIHEEVVSATIVGYGSTSSQFPGLRYEMIRLVEGVGTLLWFHALVAVFKEVIRVNVDARSRV